MKAAGFKLSVIAIVVLFSLSVKAQVDIVTLPHTFNQSQPYGYIDMNNDGTPDFIARYANQDLAYIVGGFVPPFAPAGAGLTTQASNMIVVEDSGTLPQSPAQALQSLQGGTPVGIFSTFYQKGELIGPSIVSPREWSPIAMFFGNIEPLGSPSLKDTWANGLNKGYVAVQFFIGSQLYYGWLNVEVDPNTMWFKINSSGYASAPSTPIPAGLNDPFAVPVPLIASILGMGLIGGGIVLRRRRKN